MKEDLTLQEVRAAIRTAEREILDVLSNLEFDTGLTTTDISLGTVQVSEDFKPKTLLCSVNLKVEWL